MQYYATVSEEGADLDNIMWLTLDNIGEGEEGRDPGPAGVVGSGKAVGGVVSKVMFISTYFKNELLDNSVVYEKSTKIPTFSIK